jgi:signal peptidase I
MSTLEFPLPFPPRSLTDVRVLARRLARVGGWVVIALIVVGWGLLFRPQFLGGPAAYVMVSGTSMEPVLHTGDLVIAHRRSHYRVGDTVLYRVPKGETGAGALIIHRIIGGSRRSGWMVKGDNRDTPDLWRPKSNEVIGSRWVRVPAVGRVLAYAMTPLALASLSTVLALLFGLPTAVLRAVDTPSRRRPRPTPGLRPPDETARTRAMPRSANVVSRRALAHAMTPLRLASLGTVLALLVGVTAAMLRVVDTPSRRRAQPMPEMGPPVALRPVPSPDTQADLPAADAAFSWGEAAWTARDLHADVSPQTSATR